MSNEKKENELLQDFRDFVKSDSLVPPDLTAKILDCVRRDLTPSSLYVFTKLFAVHLFVGTLSLAVCDQFGVNPFNTTFSLTNYFMKFGHNFCMTLCGFLFLGLSTVFSKVVLNTNEFIVLKNNTFIQVFFLSILSLIFFLLLGAKMVISAAAFWLLGAVLGGILIIHLMGTIGGLSKQPPRL